MGEEVKQSCSYAGISQRHETAKGLKSQRSPFLDVTAYWLPFEAGLLQDALEILSAIKALCGVKRGLQLSS